MALGSCSTAASCSRLVDESGLASTGGRGRASTWQLQLYDPSRCYATALFFSSSSSSLLVSDSGYDTIRWLGFTRYTTRATPHILIFSRAAPMAAVTPLPKRGWRKRPATTALHTAALERGCPRAAAFRRPFCSNASPTRRAWPPGGPSRSVWMTPRKADATVPGLRTLPASVGRHAALSAPVRRCQVEARACVGLAARYAKAH